MHNFRELNAKWVKPNMGKKIIHKIKCENNYIYYILYLTGIELTYFIYTEVN